MALPAPNEIIIEGRSIRVRGLVQGVGFRPTVWKIARKCGLEGDVLNDGAGVRIRAWGSTSDLDMFLQQLKEQAPPLSRIDSIEWEDLTSPFPEQGFHIVASEGGHVETGIVPDASICTACQDEISNPQNPRYRYPFTNCTHCGPRLSIVQALPYDRDHTSMAGFQMCPSCQGEYDDPSDRRFHAQPNSCPDCGPQAWLENADGDRLDVSGFRDAVDAAATFIRAGKIVAIKGIGGFHLACDAGNEDAVVMLRQRKHRYGKPLALMARDLEMASGYVSINAMERDALIGSESPIVVLERKKRGLSLASGVAPGQTCLGFMLPYTPLHLVLMADMQRPIVLTSGNRSEEPQVTENGEAL
ncbi:MAG: carbamoyltransferase HypF, partial [Rhodospirillales bacterium]|nr:carbamoyltransferase HypF [Rhodospirillales bacterium]